MKVKKEYWNNNQLKIEWTEDEDGRMDGVCNGWYKCGRLHYRWFYLNDKRHGIWNKWDKNGRLKFKGYFLYGEEVSEEEYRKHELTLQLAGVKEQK